MELPMSPRRSARRALHADFEGGELNGDLSSPSLTPSKKLSKPKPQPGEPKNRLRSQSPTKSSGGEGTDLAPAKLVEAKKLTRPKTKPKDPPPLQSPSRPRKAKNLGLSQSPSNPGEAVGPPQAPPPSKSGEEGIPGPEPRKPKNPALTQEKPSKKRKLAPFERTWSRADELRILSALANHADAHHGELPEWSVLFAALAGDLDNRDASVDKLVSKIRKLKRRHGKARLQGCPADDDDDDRRQVFQLCEKVWGASAALQVISSRGASIALRESPRKSGRDKMVLEEVQHGGGGGGGGHGDAGRLEGDSQLSKLVPRTEEVDVNVDAHKDNTMLFEDNGDADVGVHKDKTMVFEKDGDVDVGVHKDSRVRVQECEQVKAASVRREFSELSTMYPYLSEEVKGYINSHSGGALIKAAFEIIGDEEARLLDARCKKQRIDKLNLEKNQADLTKVVLSTLMGLVN